MARSRCLCVILTLWMVSSRPSASILPEGISFGAWWGTPESRIIARQADTARRAGDIAGAALFYQKGLDDARRRHDERAMVGYLNGMAACRITQMRYGSAVNLLLEAKSHAKSIHDREGQGAIAVNLANAYLQVRDVDSALKEVAGGRAAVASLKAAYFLPNLLILEGTLLDIQGQDGAASYYRQGIAAAARMGNKPLQAAGLDLLGEERLEQNDLDAAQLAIEQGMRLREQYSRTELDLSWWRMGALKKRRGEWSEAARYTGLALAARRTAPEYRLKNQRGEIRLAMGDRAGGLADLREAVQLSSRWRLEVLPASGSLTAANEMLDGFVFSSFIEAAAEEALRTHSQRWAGEAFEAAEFNRAASLRESRELSDAWHKKVPPEYWDKVGRLRQIGHKLQEKQPEGEEPGRLRLELAEMEAKAGLGFISKKPEIFGGQTSLIHFQRGLGRTELLLSFHLGKNESYLWAVTRDRLQLLKIDGPKEIRAKVEALVDAIQGGRPEAVELGERVYQGLFGQLEREMAEKPSWLLSLEGFLFEVPFSALVTEHKDGIVRYLVAKHSVQTIPGALLLSTRPDPGTGSFLGVGDPIYNAADPRWRERIKSAAFLNVLETMLPGAPPAEQYNRLVGTAAELEASSANWGSPSTVLLEGAAARRDVFLSQLASGPSIIHLATHVMHPAGKREGFIAFGLGSTGEAEYLTTSDVASLRVPGAFVAMTGCGTAFGEARPGTGLLGLTRAWQMAGASAILATAWPVRDSGGDILASFYKNLRHVPPAEALRRSQVEMLESGTWRAASSYWAPYQITGGAR